MNTFTLIAVPGGLDGDHAVLRVLISPVLDPPGPRRVADDPISAWPAMLRNDVVFSVEAAVGGGAPATIASTRRDDLLPEVWNEFFGSDEMVVIPRDQRRRSYTADPLVVPTSADADYIGSQLYPAFAEHLAPGRPADRPPPDVGAPPWAGRPQRDAAATPERQAVAQTVHFDRVLGLLREHPAVMRALGLVVDLRIAPSELCPDGEVHGTGEIRVAWPGAPKSWLVESPSTLYEIDPDRFTPASTVEIKRGLVDLRRRLEPEPAPPGGPPPAEGLAAWAVTTFDVDAAVHALSHTPPPPDSATPTQPPFLRSTGLMLMRRDRGSELVRRRENGSINAGRESIHGLTLTADDLVLGYRIDIRPENGRWRSLCRRVATYYVGDEPIPPAGALEEGHIKAAGAVIDPSGVMRADEVVARWSGWSLVVPPPNFDHAPIDPTALATQRLPFRFRWDYEVEPGSLPKLRFRTRYQIRCRVADMAGGGLGLDEPVLDEGATELVTYLRHEPVAAPVIALEAGAGLGPGATIDRLVIRDDEPSAADGRLVRPPLSTPALAEQHGMLDGDDAVTFGLVLEGPSLPDAAAGGVTIHIAEAPGNVEGPLRTDQPWASWPDLGSKRIALRGPGDDATVASPLEWEGETLVVRLAPAQQLTVEVSSDVHRDRIGDFALAHWLDGRHPMVTPVRTLELVHAVRRPLRDPSGTLTPTKSAEGQTFAVLEPPADQPLLGIDPASTVRIDITATWMCLDGSGKTLSAVVASATLSRDTRELPLLRHELGDSGHHRVTYTITAISRFREFWPPSAPAGETPDAEVEAGFLARTTLPAVSVPSAARPPTPVVLSTGPAFRWYDDEGAGTSTWQRRRRTRVGGIVRVQLARPWYISGEDEQLAVIVWPESPAPRDLWPFLTQVGKDPIWRTPPPDRFPGPSMFGSDGSHARPVHLAESDETVLAIPYNVVQSTSPSAHGAYVDIAMPEVAAASYCPFVQLAVARYQAHSIEQLELSTIVRTEMLQLFPERTLEVELIASDAVVSLRGTGPDDGSRNRVVARLEHFTGAPTDVFAIDLVAFGDEPPEAAPPMWVPVANTAVWGKLGERVQMPVPRAGGPYRIQVREVDPIGSEADEPPWGATIAHRTVFADTIVLPGEGIGPEVSPEDPPEGGR